MLKILLNSLSNVGTNKVLKKKSVQRRLQRTDMYVSNFSSSHVWMWELDCEEGWAPKTWCFWTMVLEQTLESPLDCKEIQPVHLKGDQSWVFIGRTDVEAETPVLWPPDAKGWLIWKVPDAGKDWGIEGRRRMGQQRWDGWMALLTQCTWVWVDSRNWWQT